MKIETLEDKINKLKAQKEKKAKMLAKAKKSAKPKKKQGMKIIWFSVSEAAKIGGVGQKTIRRAIDDNLIKFKIVKNRYAIDLNSLLNFLNSRIKLKNKFNEQGLGQYVEKWKNK